MIINTELSHDAEYLGDVKENRVGIDKNNIDFITTLLTSNLYSKPLESFFRETVANAYDSHIESGTDEHILILIQDTGSYRTYRISIRDYGTGVSPERFDSIYKNIGSSTKRQSNDFIGMFGIGRFSCLSCADVAHITSYYNGKKYSYVMYKNGGGINIDQLSVTEGDYKNGLEVSIEKSIYSNSDIISAINEVCLFDKVHITYKGSSGYLSDIVNNFNSRTITNFNTFTKCSWLSTGKNYFKVGNVIYKCSDVGIETINGLIIDLPMGSVDITPNREALQYTDFTKSTIAKAVSNVKKELQDIVNSRIGGDMTLNTFASSVLCNGYYALEEKGIALHIDEEDVEINTQNITLDGEVLPNGYFKFLRQIKYFSLDRSYIHTILKYKRKHRSYCVTMLDLLLGRNILADKKDKVTRHVTIAYLDTSTTSENGVVVLVYEGLDAVKKTLISYSNQHCSGSGTIFNVQDCVDFTFRHLCIINVDNSTVPKSFIDAFKEEQKSKRKKKIINDKQIPIRTYNGYGYHLDYLDKLPKEGLIVYGTHRQDDDVLKSLSGLLAIPGLTAIITIKASYVNILEGNRRFMSLDNFMFLKNKILLNLTTFRIIQENFSKICTKYHITDASFMPVYKEFYKKYSDYFRTSRYGVSTKPVINELVEYYKNKGWYNKNDVNYFTISDREIEGYRYLEMLNKRKDNIVMAMAFKKYGRMSKIGLHPVVAPKLT